MEMGHRDLQKALKHGPQRSCGLVPELLEAVVACVPLALIEKADRLLQARVGDQLHLRILAGWTGGRDWRQGRHPSGWIRGTFSAWPACGLAACAAGSTRG